VFLVGGFAESRYLTGELGKALHHHGIRIYRPDTSWTVVVQGAFICGIERSDTDPMMRASPSYAVAVRQFFSEVFHDHGVLRLYEYSQFEYVEDLLVWLLNKADLVLQGELLCIKREVDIIFLKGEEKKRTIEIGRYSGNNQPTKVQDGINSVYICLEQRTKY
jgi:hypothetical protein